MVRCLFYARFLTLLLWLHATIGLGVEGVFGNLKFENMSQDFGEVRRGETITYRFNFTNAGQGPLIIQGVHATCGCTAVEVEKGRKYQPGESGIIDVKLDTTNFVGSIVKTVTVLSNEKLLPDRILTLKAMIKTDLEADPPLLDFGDTYSREGSFKSVIIRAISPFKLQVAEIVYDKDIMEAQLVPKGAEYLLNVKLKKGLPPGFIRSNIIVKNNSRALKEMPVPVRANVKGNIDFAPNYLEFGAIEPMDNARRSLSLKGLSEFNITGTKVTMIVNGRKVDNGQKFIEISTLPHEKAKKLVSVALKNTGGITGSVHGKLFLQTSDADQKELAVDFYAFFR